jgi:two-component system OmpR family sensor kinase
VRLPGSLQGRLGLSLGILLTAMWIVAAWTTALILRNEMDEVFDAALQETAQRLLPLAVVDIVGREEEGVTQRLAVIREHEELFTYIVRDDVGRILLQSHAADPANFPAWDGTGFRQTATHRLFSEEALQGTIRITVAEPLDHRAAVAREIRMGLGLPLVVLIPLTLLAVAFAMRASLAPVLRFRERLAARTARDLSPVPAGDLPSELAPVADTLNGLLARLQAAFEAERSFAANAAHELRTPLAGAIAQVQRLQSETEDARALARAAEIEATLKRLTRFSERLMQLARAEGARLRVDALSDLRGIVRVVVEDMARQAPPGRITVSLPGQAVMSDLDPDALGILARNLMENALRHGSAEEPVEVMFEADGTLRVANAGPVVPAEILSRLAARFERGGANGDGSGLGLAIVAAIAERIGSGLALSSPRPGRADGFEALVTLPVTGGAAPQG